MKAQISLIKFNCVKILLSSVTILLVVVVLLTQANPSTSLIQQQHHLSHHQLQPQQQSAAASSSSASSILHHQQQQQQQHQHHNQQAVGKGIFKRSFAGLGCLGVYDKAKFARLDRVCEECYQLYREPDIHTACSKRQHQEQQQQQVFAGNLNLSSVSHNLPRMVVSRMGPTDCLVAHLLNRSLAFCSSAEWEISARLL